MSLYTLYVQYAGRPPETKAFDKEVITVGRDVGDIALFDPQVSGRHAELRFAAGKLVFRDLGSTNGSFMPNGERINAPVELGIGQAVRLGQSLITVQHIDFPGAVQQSRTMFAHPGAARPAPPAPGGFSPAAAPPVPGVQRQVAAPSPGMPPPRPGMAPTPGGGMPAQGGMPMPQQPAMPQPPAMPHQPAMPQQPQMSPGYPPPQQQHQPPPQQPQGFPPAPTGGYPPQQAQGYPPQDQGGYPQQQQQQQQQGYPPQQPQHQQPGYPPQQQQHQQQQHQQQQQQQGYPPQDQPQGYPPQPSAGYPPQPSAGYPPQPSAGYPPQPGYPPQGTGGYPPQPGAMQPVDPGYPQATGAEISADGLAADFKGALAMVKPVLVPVIMLNAAPHVVLALFAWLGYLVPGIYFLYGIFNILWLVQPLIFGASAYMIIKAHFGEPVGIGPAIKFIIGRGGVGLATLYLAFFLGAVTAFTAFGFFAMAVYLLEDKQLFDVCMRALNLFLAELVRCLMLWGIAVVTAGILIGVLGWVFGLIPVVGVLLAGLVRALGIAIMLTLIVAFGFRLYFQIRRKQESADPEAEARAHLAALEAATVSPIPASVAATPQTGGYPPQQPGYPPQQQGYPPQPQQPYPPQPGYPPQQGYPPQPPQQGGGYPYQ